MHAVAPGAAVAKAAAAAAVAACLVIGSAAAAADSASYNRYRDASKALRSGKGADLSVAETLFRQNLNDLEEVEGAVQADPSALEDEDMQLAARAAAHNREGLAQVYVRRRRYLKAAAEFEQACPLLELVYRDDPQIAKACRTDMRRALDLASARNTPDDDDAAVRSRGGVDSSAPAADDASSEGHESLERMADLLYRVSGAAEGSDAAHGTAQSGSSAAFSYVAILATLVAAAVAVAAYTGALQGEGPVGDAWRSLQRLRERFAARRRPLPLETLRRLQKKKEEEKAKLQEQEQRKRRSAGRGASGDGAEPSADSAPAAATAAASPSAARATSPVKGTNGPSSGQLGSAKRVSKAEIKRQRRAQRKSAQRRPGDEAQSAGDSDAAWTEEGDARAVPPASPQAAKASAAGAGNGSPSGNGGADERAAVTRAKEQAPKEEKKAKRAKEQERKGGERSGRKGKRGQAAATQPAKQAAAAASKGAEAAPQPATGAEKGEGEEGVGAEDLSVETQRGKPVARSSSDGSPRARHAQRRVVDSLVSPQRQTLHGSRWRAAAGGEEDEEVSAAVGHSDTPLLGESSGGQRERAGSLQEEFAVVHTPTRPDGPLGPGALGMSDPPRTLSGSRPRHRRSNSYGRRGVQQGAASRSVLGAAAAGQNEGPAVARAGRRTGSLDLPIGSPPRAADAGAGGGSLVSHPEWSDADEVGSVASDISASSDGTLGSAAFAGGGRKRTSSIGSQSSEVEGGAESPSERVMRLTPYHQMFEQPPPPEASADMQLRYKRLMVTREQLEYYFSGANLEVDKSLRSNMDALGFVSLTFLMDLPRVKHVAGDNVSLVMAAMDSSPDLVVALNTRKRNFKSNAELKASCFVRRLKSWEQWIIPAFSDTGSPIPMERANSAQMQEFRERQQELAESEARPVPIASRPQPVTGGDDMGEEAGEESDDAEEASVGTEGVSGAEPAPQESIPTPPSSAAGVDSPSPSASASSSSSGSRASLRPHAREFVPHPAAPAPAPASQPQPSAAGAPQRSGPRQRTYGAGTGSTPGMPVSPSTGAARFTFNHPMGLPVASVLGVQPPRSIAGVAYLPAYGGQGAGPFSMHRTPSPVLHAATYSAAPTQDVSRVPAPAAAPVATAGPYGAQGTGPEATGGFSRVSAPPRRASPAARQPHTQGQGGSSAAAGPAYSGEAHHAHGGAAAPATQQQQQQQPQQQQRGGPSRAEAPAPATPPAQGSSRRGAAAPNSGSSSGAGSGGRHSGRGRTFAKRRLVPKGMNGHTSAAEAAKAQAAARRAAPSAEAGAAASPAQAGHRGAAE